MNNHAFQLDPERLKAAGHQILATMTAIQNEQGFPPTEVVAIALYCVGAALAEIGCVIPTDGAINEYLLPLAKGYDHSFAAYSKKYAN